jgi:hypothetical protein
MAPHSNYPTVRSLKVDDTKRGVERFGTLDSPHETNQYAMTKLNRKSGSTLSEKHRSNFLLSEERRVS